MLIFIVCIIFLVGAGVVLSLFFIKFRDLKQDKFINKYLFPKTISNKVLLAYPQLSCSQLKLVEGCLRQYFIVCRRSKNEMAAMPSRVVDMAWHEFVSHRKEYHDFCTQAFGRYLHYQSCSKIKNSVKISNYLKRTWRCCCKLENIDAQIPGRAPKLFNIDLLLNIHDGNELSLEIVRHIENFKYEKFLNNIMSISDLFEFNARGNDGD